MKSSKPRKLTAQERRASERQVQEYVDRYYPEMGKVDVSISPCGTFASVLDPAKPKRKA